MSGEKALRTSSSALRPGAARPGAAGAAERGRSGPPGLEGAGWAAATGWTPAPRHGPARRVARGQGWAAAGTEAAAASAGTRRRGLRRCRGPSSWVSGQPKSKADGPTRGGGRRQLRPLRGAGAASPCSCSLPSPSARLSHLQDPDPAQPAARGRFGRLRGLERARGPRLHLPHRRLAEAAQGRPAGATPRGASAARASSQRPHPRGPPAPPRAPPLPQPGRPCVAAGAVRPPDAAGRLPADPAGEARQHRRAGLLPSAALGLAA